MTKLMPTTRRPAATVKRIHLLAVATDLVGSEGHFCILKNDFVALNPASEGAIGVSGTPG